MSNVFETICFRLQKQQQLANNGIEFICQHMLHDIVQFPKVLYSVLSETEQHDIVGRPTNKSHNEVTFLVRCQIQYKGVF